jgi:hypothetical protein
MNDLNAESLLVFARSLEGPPLVTWSQKKAFRLKVIPAGKGTPSGIEILPDSSASRNPRRESVDRVQRFCDEYYRQGRSKQPKRYAKITFQASYLLTIIARYEEGHPGN